MLRLVRPKIGRLAGQVIAMDKFDAERLTAAGVAELLSQEETIAHEAAGAADIEEIEQAVKKTTHPPVIADAGKPKRARRFKS